MAIRVSPTETNPTHDISLSDGTTTIGLHLCDGQGRRDRRAIRQSSNPRTSLQIQQGDTDYTSFNLPYTPVTQKDWSGGRGQSDYKRDSTRYYDCYRVNTIHGDITLGPKEVLADGPETTGGHYGAPDYFEYSEETGVTGYFTSYTGASPNSIRSIRFKIYMPATASGTLTAEVMSDLDGTPGSNLAQGIGVHFDYIPRRFHGETQILEEIELPISYTFSNGTKYHIGFRYQKDGGSDPAGILIGYNNGTTESIYYMHGLEDSPELVDSTASLHAVTVGVSRAKVKFFNYRGSKFAIRSHDDGTNPSLWLNGVRGFAKSNTGALNKLKTDVNLSSVGSLAGMRIRIIAGKGSTETVTWRRIVTSTTASSNNEITVSPPWQVEHDTTTEFVVLGTSYWQEVTGHGLTGPVTDVCVVGDIIYFAQGEGVVMRRGRLASGSWSWSDEAAGTKVTFIKLIPETNGTSKIWTAQASVSKVYSSDVVEWGTNLTLTQSNNSKPVGNPGTRITGMIAYGDPRIPYIFKEDGFGSISGGIYAEIPNAELEAVADERNGAVSCVQGVYLFFSLLDGFERYYDQHLDDIGPNRDEGLPEGRDGPIAAAVPYPGGIYVAVNAGPFGYSSILFWSSATNGWHEVYRAPYGRRIHDLAVQTVPGVTYQRLWFNLDSAIYWLPVAINPRKAEGYPFTDYGYLVTSWYKTTLGEIVKFWRDLQIYAETLGPLLSVKAYYQTDNAADGSVWTALPDTFTSSPVDGSLFTSNYSTTGKRLRLKLDLSSNTTTLSPRVLATTINSVTRVPPSKTWTITAQADDMSVQEGEGDYEALDMDGLLARLEQWANSETQATPLTMRSLIPQHDNKRVFIDAPNIQIREVGLAEDGRTVKAIVNLALYEA
jgi:hypothetical protein